MQPSRAWKERQSHRTTLPASAVGDGRVRGVDRAGQPGWLSPVLLQTHQVGMFCSVFQCCSEFFSLHWLDIEYENVLNCTLYAFTTEQTRGGRKV